jgi:hypothetical protein
MRSIGIGIMEWEVTRKQVIVTKIFPEKIELLLHFENLWCIIKESEGRDNHV